MSAYKPMMKSIANRVRLSQWGKKDMMTDKQAEGKSIHLIPILGHSEAKGFPIMHQTPFSLNHT